MNISFSECVFCDIKSYLRITLINDLANSYMEGLTGDNKHTSNAAFISRIVYNF